MIIIGAKDKEKPEMKSYQCIVCGHIYSEEHGDPAEAIPAGTLWEDVPDTYECPECGVSKKDFEMIEL